MSISEHELLTRLNKLQSNYERTKQAMLGEDWETKLELKMLNERQAEAIRKTILEIRQLRGIKV